MHRFRGKSLIIQYIIVITFIFSGYKVGFYLGDEGFLLDRLDFIMYGTCLGGFSYVIMDYMDSLRAIYMGDVD